MYPEYWLAAFFLVKSSSIIDALSNCEFAQRCALFGLMGGHAR